MSGETKVPFGKHRGRRLQDVPLAYLDWALSVEPATPVFREFQRSAREYLGIAGRLSDMPDRRRSRQRDGEFLDPLTREYLAIVGKG
jgi:Putative quorum-sensing-regulated virulence factor